jgi:hypothetical protein
VIDAAGDGVVLCSMFHRARAYLLGTFFLVSVSTLSAQSIERQVVASGGAHYMNASLRLDQTIGQAVFLTLQQPAITLTQGFHQPGVDLNTAVMLQVDGGDVSVFPNPTRDGIQVQFDGTWPAERLLRLRDVTGRVLGSRTLSPQNGHTSVHWDLGSLSPGTYYLTVTDMIGSKAIVLPIIKVD